MRFAVTMWVALGAVGCSGGAEGDCTPLQDGEWTVDGAAMGMTMGATVTMDAEACTFTFSDWSMSMSVPTGGSISGTELTLEGDDHWSSCTGTVNEDGTAASGTCADDGTDFTMELGAPDTMAM